MNRTALVCRACVLAAGTVTAALPGFGAALLTLGTMATVDVPAGLGRDMAAGQFAVIPIDADGEFCADKGAGYYADQVDEAAFYRCVEAGDQRMATYRFRCPDQARFDHERPTCVVRRVGADPGVR